MPDMLLPGTKKFEDISRLVEIMTDGSSLSDDALHTITTLWAGLRVLHAANAEGTCPTCPSAEAWASEALAEIRRRFEEEPNEDVHEG